jgi:hypothetical protein
MGLPTEVAETTEVTTEVTAEVTAEPLKPTSSLLARRPWKYYGYKAFSEWSASDNDFFAIRRFGALNTRVILKWQDDICQLEEKLAKIDKENSQVDENLVNNGSFRKDKKGRNELLAESFTKLKEYSMHLEFDHALQLGSNLLIVKIQMNSLLPTWNFALGPAHSLMRLPTSRIGMKNTKVLLLRRNQDISIIPTT